MENPSLLIPSEEEREDDLLRGTAFNLSICLSFVMRGICLGSMEEKNAWILDSKGDNIDGELVGGNDGGSLLILLLLLLLL